MNSVTVLSTRSTPQQAGKTRAVLTGTALFLFLTLVGFAPLGFATESPPVALDLEDIVPAETLLYFKCAGMEQLIADGASLDIFKLWNDPEIQAFFADATKMAHGHLSSAGEGGQWGEQIKQLWSLLQGDMAIAITPRLTIFAEGAAPSTALSVDMGDNKESFLATVDGFLDLAAGHEHLDRDSIEYRGFTINRIGKAKHRLMVCYATVKNLFVATINPYFMKEIIDCHLDQKAVLAGNPAFGRCLDKVGGAATRLMAFVNLEVPFKMAAPLWPYEFAEWFDMLGISEIDALCFASATEGGGSRDSFFIDCPGKKKGLLKALSPRPVSPDVLRKAPEDTIFFLDFILDPELVVKEVDGFVKTALPEFYGEFRQGFEIARRETGLDLEKEVFAPLGGEVSLMVTMPKSGGMVMIPDIIASVTIDDVERFTALQDKILSMLPKEVRVSKSTFGAYTLRYITVPEEGIPFSPTFTIADQTFLVASNPITMKRYLKWLESDSPSLGDSAVFKAAMADVPDNASILEFVNVPQIVGLAYQNAAPFLPGLLDQEELPFDMALLPMSESITKHLSSAVSYGVVDEDGILMAGRWSLGCSSILSAIAAAADYLVDNDLVSGIVAATNHRVHGPSQIARKPKMAGELETATGLLGQGKYADAERAFTSWLAKNPEHKRHTWALTNRGYCRLALGRYEEGVADYEKVTKRKDGNFGLAYYNIACGSSRLKQVDKALSSLEKAILAGFDDKKLMKEDPDLENIRSNPRFGALYDLID